MRLCFVGPANSSHIVKWCTWFSRRGYDVDVVSFTQGNIEGTKVHLIDTGADANGSDFDKLKYLLTGGKIKKCIEEVRPDVINVHYASSYGIATALSGIRGYALSVWGSDIYSFPRKSILHRTMLEFSLRKAGYLFSTSQAMAKEAGKYTNRKFEITPFGVDLELFNPNKKIQKTGNHPFIVGTVKTLSDLYGIDFLLKAVAKINNEHPEINMQTRLSGDGPCQEKYKKMAGELGISDKVLFLGRISPAEAAKEWANMDIAVIPSAYYESFGVSAIEAQASGTPLIISDVEGLLETTKPNESSIVVPKRNENAIAEAILRLYKDVELRKKMGRYGRENVVQYYELNTCFEHIEKLLTDISKNCK